MRFLFGNSRIHGDMREACVQYYAKELILKQYQEIEANRFNEKLMIHGNSFLTNEASMKELSSASRRLSDTAKAIHYRHSALSPVPRDAGAMYFAWEGTYADYQMWASAQNAALGMTISGGTPLAGRVKQLLKSSEQSRHKAEEEEKRFLKRLDISPEQIRQCFNEAASIVENSPLTDEDLGITVTASGVFSQYITNIGRYEPNAYWQKVFTAWHHGGFAATIGFVKNLDIFKGAFDLTSEPLWTSLISILSLHMISYWYSDFERAKVYAAEERGQARWNGATSFLMVLWGGASDIEQNPSIKAMLFREADKFLKIDSQYIYERQNDIRFPLHPALVLAHAMEICGAKLIDWENAVFPFPVPMEYEQRVAAGFKEPHLIDCLSAYEILVKMGRESMFDTYNNSVKS
jgi:hypothetical protein